MSPRLKNIIVRIAAVTAIIVTIHWLITPTTNSADIPKLKSYRSQRDTPANLVHEPREAVPVDVAPTSNQAVAPGDVQQTPGDTQKPNEKKSDESVIPKVAAGESQAPPVESRKAPEQVPLQTSNTITAARDVDLESALQRVIDLLPNELTTRGLLSPVQGSGKEKLREMGLRSRQYKAYFEAWSKLHFVPANGDIFIRDDIIQYLRKHTAFAESLSTSLALTVRKYEAFRHFLHSFADLLFPWTAPYFADHMTLHKHFYNGGRGIVLTGGDGQAPFLLTNIANFRKLGCTLPIEIMYLGENDLSEEWRVELEGLDGVLTRDMGKMVRDEGWTLRGWAAKPFAILLSSFREVIFIDADALFFKDPAVMFDEPLYKETGTLFFKDRIIMPESKKQWLKEVLPAPVSSKAKMSRYWSGVSGHMQESGVVVVDKWQHLIELLLTTRMNGPDRDGNKDKKIVGVYDMVYGDKETYWLAWELVGSTKYAFHEGQAGIMGKLLTPEQIEERQREKDGKPKDKKEEEAKGYSPPEDPNNPTQPPPPAEKPQKFTICAPQLLHLDMEGKPLWFNGWILSNKFEENKKKRTGSTFEAYLREPREDEKKEEGEEDPWQLQQHNEACLSAKEEYRFEPSEQAVLNDIIEEAKRVGAYGKG